MPVKADAREEISVAYFCTAFRVRRVSTPGPDAPLIVFVTVPDVQAGASLARVLVGEQLAACVNILPGARSIYAWKGEIKDEGEALCLVKTRAELFPALAPVSELVCVSLFAPWLDGGDGFVALRAGRVIALGASNASAACRNGAAMWSIPWPSGQTSA